jgi:hypothetical protein
MMKLMAFAIATGQFHMFSRAASQTQPTPVTNPITSMGDRDIGGY